MSERINVMVPWLGEEEAAAVAETIASGWVAQGPRVAQFEREFAASVQVPHAVATTSCTTALHLALIVAGIGPGDEVVVPSLSFIATTNAVRYVGAKPVFADVDPISGNLTAAAVGEVLTSSTRAIIAVDQGGVPVDLAPLRAMADPLGIVVVEDAACGAGSIYDGRPVGARADIAAWSFHPRKLLTTGEGGMLTTHRADWAARARRLREHATSASAADRHQTALAAPERYTEVGFNFRMTDMQAAVGMVQLQKLPAVVARRRELAQVYRAELAGVPGLRLVDDPEWGQSNFQTLWVQVSDPYPLDRDALIERLADAEISARRGIMAAHLEPAYRSREGARVSLPVTENLTATTLVLPLYHTLTGADIRRICEVIASAALPVQVSSKGMLAC